MSDPLKSDPLLQMKPNSIVLWPITLAICICLTIYMDWNKQNFLSVAGLGYLTGTIALLVGLPGLVFRWTTLGRKYWPLATLVLMGLVWIGR